MRAGHPATVVTSERFRVIQPWLSSVVRVTAGCIFIAAGASKLADLPASVRATRAYRLLPEAIVPFIGRTLPFLEIAIGLLLIVGLVTRVAAIVYVLMMAAFVVGIASAWVRGFQIECGCFGGGGETTTTDYLGHMLNQAFFISLGVWLVVFPRSVFSFEGLIRSTK